MKNKRTQYTFGAYGDGIFLFLKDSLNNYSVAIVTVDEGGSASVETFVIAPDSDLYNTITQKEYLNDECITKVTIWPTLIFD